MDPTEPYQPPIRINTDPEDSSGSEGCFFHAFIESQTDRCILPARHRRATGSPVSQWRPGI
jgi:hypothetical protein